MYIEVYIYRYGQSGITKTQWILSWIPRHTRNHFIALQGLLPMHTVDNRLQKSGSISLITNDSPSITLYKLTATSASRSPPSDSCTPTLCMPIKC